jgi:exosortase
MERQPTIQIASTASRKVDMFAAGLWILSLALFLVPLTELVSLGLTDDRYSYVLLVPVISAFLLWLRKDSVLQNAQFSPALGLPMMVAGVEIAAAFPSLSATMFGVWLTWVGIAGLCYGRRALVSALFPLLFLLLFVPAPNQIMEQLVAILQQASADTTAVLLQLTGISFERHGFEFALGAVDIEVAKECSGIRSSISMFIGAILASHLLLRGGWNRVGFAMVSIPIVIFKNAARITGITWLGLNVDQGFFTGDLHRYSGLPFSLLALAMLVPTLLALRRVELGPQAAA